MNTGVAKQEDSALRG